MSRATLAVVCDQLRALGLEDVARWVEHPDAVRELLKATPHMPYDVERGGEGCDACSVGYPLAVRIHARDCRIAAAWRALGDPRGQADIERAHEEALELQRRSRDRRNEMLRTGVHWLKVPYAYVSPGWVDRGSFGFIPDHAFDFSRVYDPLRCTHPASHRTPATPSHQVARCMMCGEFNP